MTERRLLIIGLDGATFDVIDPLLAVGKMPNLARLIRGGVRGRLRSTIPPVTAAAWPSLLTGKNPARHGIYGFRSLGLDEYSESREFASSRSIAGQTIFDYLNRLGHDIASYLVPMTYPVWPVKGVMVAGFPTPDIRIPYTWPKKLSAELGNFADYTMDDVHKADPAGVLRNATAFTDRLVRDLSRWIADPAYRLVMYVVSPLDYFQHRFWSLREPSLPMHREQAARYGDVIARMYELQDQAIGRLIEQIDSDWLVAVVSDHGGGKKADRIWNVNQWLRSRGLLKPAGVGAPGPALLALSLARNVARRLRLRDLLGRYAPKSLQKTVGAVKAAADAVDWAGTRAHYVQMFYPAGGINLNVRGRQAEGVVAPGAEYERLRDEIMAALRGVTDPKTGRRVVLEVYKREEVYSGRHAESAPDVVFVHDPAFECGSRLDVPFLDAAPPGPEDWTGDHRIEGIMVLHGRGVFKSGLVLERPQITDVAPTLLHGMGLPVPADMDGRVLAEALDAAFAAAHPIETGEPVGDGFGASMTYSEEEEEGIKASLRGLGYIQ